MQEVAGIRVYDICALHREGSTDAPVIAERFADYLKVHPNLHRPHGHSFYHLLLFSAGSGFHTIDFQRHPVTPGQIYFMAPGQVHSWNFEDSVDGYVVNFSEALFGKGAGSMQELGVMFPFLAGSVSGENVIQLSSAGAEKAAAMLNGIAVETAVKGLFSLELIAAQLLSLFIVVARESASPLQREEKIRPGQLLLHNFRKLEEANYAELRLPKDYAASLYITPNHLNALCHDLLGKSAGDVIRERILLEAKRLLVNTEAGIAEIGYRLGFADNSYFTKFFKRQTGTTPEAFRRAVFSEQPAT